MSFTAELVIGAAERLHASGVATWRATGTYLPGEIPITRGALPSSPDRAVALTTYTVDDDYTLSDSVIGLQVITRGTTDQSVVDDLDDAVFNALHGLAAVTLGTVRVVSISRESGVSLGTDDNKRWMRSSNYYVTAHRPSPHRT